MAHSTIAEAPASIDQIMQNGQLRFSAFHSDNQDDDSTSSVNRTAPLTPPTSSRGSPHRNSHQLGYDLRSSSQTRVARSDDRRNTSRVDREQAPSENRRNSRRVERDQAPVEERRNTQRAEREQDYSENKWNPLGQERVGPREERESSRAQRGDFRAERDNIGSKRAPLNQQEEPSGNSRGLNKGNGVANGSAVSGMGSVSNFLDFFSSEVFQIVLHNPTTAHRLLRFCQSRACGETMEFLQKVHTYHRLIDEVTQTMSTIHRIYTSPDAPRELNISTSLLKQVASDVRQSTQYTIPGLDSIFAGAQEQVESLLAGDIYPRFVKHQITTSATMAMADHRERFQGLGDCFCLTDPRVADNPILYASDGFVSVTGYTRKDIIPRNCRFLQGPQTDALSTKRLRYSIQNCDETVELLLNYRKNGDPFWNLLYVSPLFNEKGEVTFFLGGQINCSTTIHSCNDVLRVLSINDDELDELDEEAKMKPPSLRSKSDNVPQWKKTKSSFFKSWKKYTSTYANSSSAQSPVRVRDEAGMEGELLNKVGKLNFKTQVEAFYTAYSKYIVLSYGVTSQTLTIQHYSPGVIDMLSLNLPNGGIVPIYNKDVFKILAEYSSSSSSISKNFKQTVRDAIRVGRAVSVEIGLLTGYTEKKQASGFRFGVGSGDIVMRRVEEKYVMHWTPLKDEEGRPKFVVLAIAPK